MKIKKAEQDLIDPYSGRRVPGTETIKVKGDLDLKVTRDHSNRKVAEIRRHVRDADLASEQGNDSDLVLMDWFVVYDADVTIFGEAICITGYSVGALGVRRDGKSPYPDGRDDPYHSESDEPLVRVEWMLR